MLADVWLKLCTTENAKCKLTGNAPSNVQAANVLPQLCTVTHGMLMRTFLILF
jgi:hypothetical protein